MAKAAAALRLRPLLMHRLAPACSASATLLRPGAARSFYSLSSLRPILSTPNCMPSGCRSRFWLGRVRCFSEDLVREPNIKDYVIYYAYKDLMADSWDDLSDRVVCDVKQALCRDTDDKSGQAILENVYRSAEAVQEFSGMLSSLKMELDDSIGFTGEDVKPLSDEVARALQAVFERYNAYLDSFGPEESYLRKKVEMELGAKMIHLKMRCSGLGSAGGRLPSSELLDFPGRISSKELRGAVYVELVRSELVYHRHIVVVGRFRDRALPVVRIGTAGSKELGP